MVKIGDPAPDFTLLGDSGTVSLSALCGRKVVIFFYPKADTPACTTEARDFSALAGAFAAAGTALIGISADAVKKQCRFKARHGLALPLASDPGHQAIDAYGVWGEKTLFGRRYLGIIRTTVLVDRDGRVARIWSKVSVPAHAEEVLAAARTL